MALPTFQRWIFWTAASFFAVAGCKKKQAAAPPPANAPRSQERATVKASLAWGPAQELAGAPLAPTEGAWDRKSSRWDAALEGQDARSARLSLPYVAVEDAKGRVFIADKRGHAVRMVDAEGEIHTVAGTGVAGDCADEPTQATQCALHMPNALWAGSGGRLYILDFGNAKLRRLDAQGRIQTLFSLPKPLHGGRGLVASADEKHFYIAAKDRIYHYDVSEGLTTYARGFHNLAHLTLGSAGELWAADRDANRVFRIPSADQVLPMAGDGSTLVQEKSNSALETGLDGPRALLLLEDQSLLIGTQSGRRIYRLDPTGRLSLMLDGNKPERETPLSISAPLEKLRALTRTPKGDLLLTHGDAGAVLRFPAKR